MEKLLFKKVEFWVVLVVVILALIMVQVSSWAVFHQLTGGTMLGRFGAAVVDFARIPQNAKRLLSNENPYLVRENRFGDQSGWRFSYPLGTRPDAPFVLMSRSDPDARIGVNELIDLNTRQVVFRDEWNIDKVWDEIDFQSNLGEVKRDSASARFAPAHALMLPGGRIVAKYLTPLLASDACGRKVAFNDRYVYHHSLEPDAEGNIWTAAYLEPKTVDIGTDLYIDDGLVKLSPEGEILFQKSVSQLLIDNGLGHLVYGLNDFIVNDDRIHLNDVQPVMTTGPFWEKGDVFLSLRHLSMVLLYRPSTNEVLWYRLGLGTHQHDVNVISDHEISVFDNNTIDVNGRRGVDGTNRIMVYDFDTDTTHEVFADAMAKNAVRTATNGRGRLLDDGRLYVEETDFGRAMALNRDGSIDWQFINRGKDGKLYFLRWARIVERNTAESFLAARAGAVCN